MHRKYYCPFVVYLLLSLLPASFAFLSPLFFLFWAFTRLPFGGNWFCKKFEDGEFFLKEVPVGSGTRFSLEFSGQSYTVFCVFVRLERPHLPAQVSCQSCLGPLKLMTSQVVQGTSLNKGGYGRFRGQCVKVWVRSRRFFPISFGSFSGTYFEVCQTERYVHQAEGESSNKLIVSCMISKASMH